MRNVAQTLGSCLQSCCDAFEEIIVVDLGSADDTMEIARQYADKRFRYDFDDDWAAAWNFAFSKATGDYIMWLEAGDSLLPADLRRLWQLKSRLQGETDALIMPYDRLLDENGHAIVRQYRERLLRRGAGFSWEGRVHPEIPLSGTVKQADIRVVRQKGADSGTDGNLAICRRMLTERGSLPPRDILWFARDLRESGRFREAAEQFEQYLLMPGVSAEDAAAACFELSFCYQSLEDRARMADVLVHSLKYAPPRAGTCCRIGETFFEREQYKDAAFWYALALKLGPPPETGFRYPDYEGYIPALQLCLCHYRLGDIPKAVEYNRLAGEFKPRDKSVRSNERFFRELQKHRQETD